MNAVSPIEPFDANAKAAARFMRGFRAPFRAFRTLADQRELWTWVVVPILITTALMGGAMWTAVAVAPRVTDTLWPVGADPLPAAQLLVRNTLWAFLLVTTWVLSTVAAWFTGVILASPFYDRLSEQVERLHDATPARPTTSAAQIAGDIAVGVLHSFGNFALYMSLSCPLACVQGVPFVGEVLGVIGGTLLSSGLVAIEVLDFSLARRRYGWWQKLRWLWSHRATMLGLGFGSWILLLVPLGGFVITPVAVIAATELFIAMQRADALPE
jgi:uncharacterized protein involved in cysteine biosynthesis